MSEQTEQPTTSQQPAQADFANASPATPPQQPTPATQAPEQPREQVDGHDIALDLDALTATSKYIKFQGKAVELQQPTTEQLLKLIGMGEKLKSMGGNAENMTEENLKVLGETLQQVNELARSLAPTLPGELNLPQAFAMIGLFSDMAMPTEQKELRQRGITPADLPKDVAS